ncbi:hypothetical protein [Streptomyces sp. NPDC006879]|uniref:hypothetical protein n=1 Tax=Streptomyces sp. NPDC006879 TaxID=3364767 RepID=UPI0036D1F92F
MRSVARWSAAVLVFASAATAAALGITRQERTELPGLGTLSDGRWTYPTLAKPSVPAGAPLPNAPDNPAGIHFGELAGYLLPPPEGADLDRQLGDGEHRVSVDRFLSEYTKEAAGESAEVLHELGLRQIVARGWGMPEGERTRIYLLRFNSAGAADRAMPRMTDDLKGTTRTFQDQEWSRQRAERSAKGTLAAEVDVQECELDGTKLLRVASIQVGDTIAVVIQGTPRAQAPVPFHQTVLLQEQLLS